MPFLFDFLYLFAALTAGPFFLARRLLSKKKLAPFRARLFGFPTLSPGRAVVWVHGVSVGEILAARGLVRRLEQELPGRQVVLSTTTAAGYDVARREYPHHVVFYSPLDLGGAVRRALRRVHPELVILMELELWPNLLFHLHERGVPVVVANGKLSESSRRGYRRLLRLVPQFLEPVARFCVQNATYADRIGSLGVDPGRIRVTGSVKVDNLPRAPEAGLGRELRRDLRLGEDPVLLAGSTHEGEETIVFRAYVDLKQRLASLRLIIAPRHAERVPAIVQEGRRFGLDVTRRTALREGDPSPAVILVDTMGELARLFAAADVVFLGGSLVPVGGHNILEPAAQGRVVVIGPYVWTIKDFATELLEDGAVFEVRTEHELVECVAGLMLDEARRLRAGRAGQEMVDRHRGATERTVEIVCELLSSRREKKVSASE